MAVLWQGRVVHSESPAIYSDCTYNYWRSGNTMVYVITSTMYCGNNYAWRNNRWANKLWFNGEEIWSNKTIKNRTNGNIGTTRYSETTFELYANVNGGSVGMAIQYADTGASYNWQGTVLNTFNGYLDVIPPTAPNTPNTPTLSEYEVVPSKNLVTLNYSNKGGGTNGVNGYEIWYKKNEGNWQVLVPKAVSESYNVNLTPHNLKHGDKLYFAIKAFSMVNGQNYYSGLSGQCQLSVTSPMPKVTKLKLKNKTTDSVELEVSYSIGETLTLSKIYFSKDNGETYDDNATNALKTYSELNSYTLYRIKVKVVDSAGREAVGELSVTTNPMPPVISEFKATEITKNKISLSVSATAQALVDKYKYSKDNGINWSELTENNYISFEGLNDYTDYTFKVIVYDKEGFSTEQTLTLKTQAVEPLFVSESINELTDEKVSVSFTFNIQSVKGSKAELRINNGQFEIVPLSTTGIVVIEKEYVELEEEKDYNIDIIVWNEENNHSEVHTLNIRTLPGKFVTLIKDGESPRKVHTYIIYGDGRIKKLTKRTRKIIKGE
nr:MAG TPA: FIBRONECTIN, EXTRACELLULAR MATRIX, CELL ADHESION.0A [Caudoviricetes sp.]